MAVCLIKQTATKTAELLIGQTLRGRAGSYVLTKQLEDSVWIAKDSQRENVIVKSVRHWRLQNERDVLRRFQHRTAYLRPLIDEIENPSDPPAIVLRWLDDDMLNASNAKRLTRPEVKHVAKGVLEALRVMHEDGCVHADVKPKNILVNYGKSGSRFQEVQLADLGGSVSEDSEYAKEGEEMGTPIFRSPEAQLQLQWGPPTDIWSLGATVNFHMFKPGVPIDHPDYLLHIVLKYHRLFGPWPTSYAEIADDKVMEVLDYTMSHSPKETLTPFKNIVKEELCREDKQFLLKIMKLDPRDRPTARELLDDPWFYEDVPAVVTSSSPSVAIIHRQDAPQVLPA
ncbi:kinase-like domain-containing protein [Massariosphaeria phaeospora]|uniref:Kinase-like domain-containing protein n=1 Tax=Massariosphaeria phaeospora TaxID=100035 RepID=A0A7C8I6H6_9PLEO|nr:kinase-like domain-containing protein [Massariosphaeria phaeospora]